MRLERKETLAALDPLKSALAVRSAIQELGHIWFDGEYAYAHNGGLGVRVKFEGGLSCGIPGGLFLGLLNQTAEDTLEFEVSDSSLVYKAGKASVELATLPIEQKVWRYPERPNGKAQASIKTSEGFLDGLKRVFVLKPTAPQRMEHYAVCIFPVEKEMDLYVTDSKSLVVMPVQVPVVGGAKKLALPREMAEQIVSRAKGGKELKMYEDHFQLDATDKITLYSNVFDTGEMLDLPSFADKFSDDKEAPPFDIPKGFHAALERAVLLAGADEPAVSVSVSGKALKLSGRFKFGKLDEEFPLSKSVAKGSLRLDAKTLLSVKEATQLAIGPSAANLRHKDGFMFILSSKEDPKVPATRSKRPRADDEED